jgi:phage FluMu protein Com
MQSISCSECLKAMARGRSELLVRIACANCQQAQEDLAQAKTLVELSPRTVLGMRCPQCGKWCLTKNALVTHQGRHMIGALK